jgi:hypothetical protein
MARGSVGQVRLPQQLAVAVDDVQRRAQLVRDARQEVPLGLGAGLGDRQRCLGGEFLGALHELEHEPVAGEHQRELDAALAPARGDRHPTGTTHFTGEQHLPSHVHEVGGREHLSRSKRRVGGT